MGNKVIVKLSDENFNQIVSWLKEQGNSSIYFCSGVAPEPRQVSVCIPNSQDVLSIRISHDRFELAVIEIKSPNFYKGEQMDYKQACQLVEKANSFKNNQKFDFNQYLSSKVV